MEDEEVERLLEMDIKPLLNVRPGVGFTIAGIIERMGLVAPQVSESWIGFVITRSFDVFLYYDTDHLTFNASQGIDRYDIIRSGYFFPKNLEKGITSFGLNVRGEGIIDRWMHRQRPLSPEAERKFLKFRLVVQESLYECFRSFRAANTPPANP